MLTKRIIPCLDVKEGRVVKGIKFLSLRDAGDPAEIASFYDKEGADEIVFLDITASHEKRPILLDVVKKTAESVFMPLTVGGGIRDLDDIRILLNAGADKVSINTSAVKNPLLVKDASDKFGSQCIVVAIDAKRTKDSWQVYINGGRTPVEKDAIKWAREVEKLGAGELLLTSMDYDGTKDGYDLELTKKICNSVNISVIASGGAGKLKHFAEVLTDAAADAALAASVFHYKEFSIREVKEFLKKEGLKVRL
ncbi:MAG: imidazole glycerol phosphate synthase subunit HisF [Candidatus Omnitrophota bacterium]